MPPQFRWIALALLPILAATSTLRAQAPGEVDARAVNLAIDRATEFLVSTQDKGSKTWQDHHGQPGGLTALCALLNLVELTALTSVASVIGGLPVVDQRFVDGPAMLFRTLVSELRLAVKRVALALVLC